MRLFTAALCASLFSASAAHSADWKSYSTSAMSGSGINDFAIEFRCENGKPAFLLEHDHYLGLHGSKVEVTLGEVSKPSISFTMRVLSDDDTRAYTLEARDIAKHLMGADSIVMYVTPEYRNKMFSQISMRSSDYAIYRLFENCGETLENPKPRKPVKKPEMKESKTDRLATATADVFERSWYPNQLLSQELEAYLKVTLTDPERRDIDVEIIEGSDQTRFDKDIAETLKGIYYLPAFEVAPKGEDGQKYFCIRVRGQEAEVDLHCGG